MKYCIVCKKSFLKSKKQSYDWYKNAKFCSRLCYFKTKIGTKLSEETKRKIGKSNSRPHPWMLGENNVAKRLDIRAKIKNSKVGYRPSDKCLEMAANATRGKRGRNWKGGKTRNSYGYVLIWQPEHPFCYGKGYVFEHRLVMEKHIGRLLEKGEVVHHLDRNRKNNSIENLMLFKNSTEHMEFHRKFY